MIRLLVILYLLLNSELSISAQSIVERSSKKRPDWIGLVRENFLIVSATGATIEDAKQKCLNSVKIQMLESVAQNIEHSAETIIEQVTHNQDVNSDITFKQKSKTNVVNLPYISGVSLDKACEAYWECLIDNATGKRIYTYSLMYPYTTADYRHLKDEFERLDAEMVSIVQDREKSLNEVYSIDTIESYINDLLIVEEYFFDTYRKNNVHNVIQQYKAVFSKLNIESKRIGKCKFRCWITYNGNVMECSVLPRCKSETATKIKCTIDDESYVITFSNEECIDDDTNSIDVSFMLKYNTIKHKLYF